MEPNHINSTLVGNARNLGPNEKRIQSFGGNFFWLALCNWRYKLNTQRGHAGLDVTKDRLSVRLRKEDF